MSLDAATDAPASQRLLLVTTSYPRWPGDAAGGFVEARVRELLAAGISVEVIAAGEPEDPGTRVSFSVPGQPALFYGDGAPERLETAGAAWLQALRFWGGLVAALRASLRASLCFGAPVGAIESHWLVPCSLAVAAVSPGLPHRAVAHSGDVALLERLPAGLGPLLARWLEPRVTSFCFASADLRSRFAALLASEQRARVLAAEVRPAPIAVLPIQAHARSRTPRTSPTALVLAVGRLVSIKGHDVLVRAVGRLAPGARPRLVVLGEGPERERLAELARRREVDLHLPGNVPHAEVAGWLARADVFVQPSRPLPSGRTEGAPVALQEALAAGVPIVASRTGGIPDLVDPRPDRWLVTADDVAALTRALGAALERHDLETDVLHQPDSRFVPVVCPPPPATRIRHKTA